MTKTNCENDKTCVVRVGLIKDTPTDAEYLEICPDSTLPPPDCQLHVVDVEDDPPDISDLIDAAEYRAGEDIQDIIYVPMKKQDICKKRIEVMMQPSDYYMIQIVKVQIKAKSYEVNSTVYSTSSEWASFPWIPSQGRMLNVPDYTTDPSGSTMHVFPKYHDDWIADLVTMFTVGGTPKIYSASPGNFISVTDSDKHNPDTLPRISNYLEDIPDNERPVYCNYYALQEPRGVAEGIPVENSQNISRPADWPPNQRNKYSSFSQWNNPTVEDYPATEDEWTLVRENSSPYHFITTRFVDFYHIHSEQVLAEFGESYLYIEYDPYREFRNDLRGTAIRRGNIMFESCDPDRVDCDHNWELCFVWMASLPARYNYAGDEWWNAKSKRYRITSTNPDTYFYTSINIQERPADESFGSGVYHSDYVKYQYDYYMDEYPYLYRYVSVEWSRSYQWRESNVRVAVTHEFEGTTVEIASTNWMQHLVYKFGHYNKVYRSPDLDPPITEVPTDLIPSWFLDWGSMGPVPQQYIDAVLAHNPTTLPWPDGDPFFEWEWIEIYENAWTRWNGAGYGIGNNPPFWRYVRYFDSATYAHPTSLDNYLMAIFFEGFHKYHMILPEDPEYCDFYADSIYCYSSSNAYWSSYTGVNDDEGGQWYTFANYRMNSRNYQFVAYSAPSQDVTDDEPFSRGRNTVLEGLLNQALQFLYADEGEYVAINHLSGWTLGFGGMWEVLVDLNTAYRIDSAYWTP